MSEPFRSRLRRHARRWPYSLAATSAITVLLGAWLVPIAYDHWQVAGLDSADHWRQNLALRHLRTHADRSPRLVDLAIARIPDMDSWPAAVQTALILNPSVPPARRPQLVDAVVDAGRDTRLSQRTVSVWHTLLRDQPATQRMMEDLRRRLTQRPKSAQYDRLISFCDDLDLWRPEHFPPAAWLPWLDERVASDNPVLRRLALEWLIGEATPDAKQDADPGDLEAVAALLDRLAQDEDPDIRRGAAFASLAWQRAVSGKAERESWRSNRSDNPSAKPHPAFGRVVPEAPAGSPPDDPDIALLWELEHTPRANRSLEELNVSDPLSLPPLQQIMLVRASREPKTQWLLPALTHDEPHLRALAVIIADRFLSEADRNRLFEELTRDLDPIARQSGILLRHIGLGVGEPITTDPNDQEAWYQDPGRIARLDDPTTRVLLTSVGRHPDNPAANASLLSDPRFDQPVVLAALLAEGIGPHNRVGWDHVLGPFGLPNDKLITLLDRHRFAWVLDAVMPKDAPRFPLWVDRQEQLEAIAALRTWYAQNRTTWTHY
ncbi:MAG: hypothetical protein AAGE65_06635 [Planctomycetota bacterium]